MVRRVICGHFCVPCAQTGKLPRLASDLELLKMLNVVESMESTMRLQLKLVPRRAIFAMRTRVLILISLAFSFSVSSSCFSSICSSLNVGLRGFNRPGVPGTFKALLSGEPGVGGISTPPVETCFAASLSDRYPKPTSEGCG